LLPYFQYYSILLVHDWYYVQVYRRGLAPILPVTLRLLVFDEYSMLLKGPCSHISSTTLFYWFTTGTTCKFTEGASLPFFQ
jgi:hypothetical protein